MTARRRVGLTACLTLGAAIGVGATSRASAPPTTTPPTTTRPTTTTTPPADLLAGVAWIQREFASPCTETTVQMIGGSGVDRGALAVLDDVVTLDARAGLAVAFLSCHVADGSTTETTALLVRVTPSGGVASVAEQELGRAARVVAVDLPSFTVESAEGTPRDGACCAPLIRRRTYVASIDGLEITDDRQVAAFLQTVAPPPIAGDGDLVRSSVPAAALCYRWDDVYLGPHDLAEDPVEITTPSAELQTLRLALIHVTGRWITPSPVMTLEMSDVARSYQESRDLTVDGLIGAETTNALSADLGCFDVGEFRQIDPIGLGPRRFRSVSELLTSLDRYRRTGSTGNASLTALLRDAAWDGDHALFLGCSRREVPPAGVSCSWSGRTPLQLIGLVDDPTTPGVTSFSILYARSAAPST